MNYIVVIKKFCTIYISKVTRKVTIFMVTVTEKNVPIYSYEFVTDKNNFVTIIVTKKKKKKKSSNHLDMTFF